jgi:hypothetical protein
VMATATAMAAATKMETVTATAMVVATEMATAIAMATATATAMMTVTTTDTREGCLFISQRCAALWQGQRSASPPGHKGVGIDQCCAIWVSLQRVFAPFQGGGILRAHLELVLFLYFSTTCKVY